MFSLTTQFILGLLYANAGEWWVHKHILHALGKIHIVSGLITGMSITLFALKTRCLIQVINL